MTTQRLIIIVVCSVLTGLGTGIMTNVVIADGKDQQIQALTSALNQLRLQLASDEAIRREDERKLRAFNSVDQPPKFAKPQTFQGGFQ